MKKTKTKTKPWKEHYWFTIGRHLLSRTFFLIIFLFKKSQTMCIMGLINGRLIEVLIPDSILQ